MENKKGYNVSSNRMINFSVNRREAGGIEIHLRE